MSSEGSSSPAPAESFTPAPEGRSTPAPAGSSTLAPAESFTPAPEGRSTPAPAGSSTLAPAESFTPAPEGSSTLAPAESFTPAPEGSSTLAPEGSSTLAPEGSSTHAPEGSCTLALAESSTRAPECSSTPAPEGRSALAPAGSSTLAPVCSCTPAPPGSSTSAPEDSFTAVSSSQEWNEGLKRSGSCLKLFDLLQNRPELLHELGPDGITVLHKGVDHGCVKLVKYVLVNMFNEAGICKCKREENGLCALTREGLLRKTTEYGSTAVNMAIVSGSPKMVLLLEWAIRVGDKEEVVNVADEVPDVKDDEISESIYTRFRGKTYDRDMQLELYKLIAAKLKEMSTGEHQWMDVNGLKERCAKHVDFEFVPVEHIFLHFLLSGKELHRASILENIVEECKMWDEKNKTAETMQMTLFSILDPRGRTIMHTLNYNFKNIEKIVEILKGVASKSGKRGRCYTAKDGAGRTLYHMASIYDHWYETFGFEIKPEQYPHVNIKVTPLCYNEFKALQHWSFDKLSVECMEQFYEVPIYLAILSSSEDATSNLLQGHAKEGFLCNIIEVLTPFQMACALRRTKLMERFAKVSYVFTLIFEQKTFNKAASGQVEVVQMILKNPFYDPMCQDVYLGNTALHAVVGMKTKYIPFEYFKIWALKHVLPNSHCFKRIEGSLLRHEAIKDSPRDFTKNEKICINLLLQAGIDMWTPNNWGEFPNVGSDANNEARSWWYDKVVKEVETKKASISSAANATSVVGALVATTSFIGPLQPPLSYSSEGGYVNANPISIRIYLVCNIISFFFSIASILMAVLPSIPMSKESLYEEMIRSERCLKAAITLLLISIICILVSFSSASLAVVSSQWHDRKLIVASMIIGGGVCVVVLVIFIIRLLRIVFHNNSWLRRKFAKHMYF